MNNELLDFMTWVNQNKKLGYTPIGIERIVNTYTTSKERGVNQIVDEVYNNYLTYIHDVVQGENQIYGGWYGKEEFINKCKTDPEFSDEWGLKIEERELSMDERFRIAYKDLELRKKLEAESKMLHFPDGHKKVMDNKNIPTRLTTITYKEQTIESYE
jgi:hypothetical protein